MRPQLRPAPPEEDFPLNWLFWARAGPRPPLNKNVHPHNNCELGYFPLFSTKKGSPEGLSNNVYKVVDVLACVFFVAHLPT